MGLTSAHQGYEYQDLLTAYFILKEILSNNLNSSFDIDKKHYPDDRFDDLTIQNSNGIQRKQIKYSNEDTSKELIKDDLSNDSNYKLAIFKLFESWKKLNTSNSEFRLCLAWGEPTEETIRNSLKPSSSKSSFEGYTTKLYHLDLEKVWEVSPQKFNRWDSLKRYVKSEKVDRKEFKLFCDSLVIELDFPKEEKLKLIVSKQIEKLGIGQYPNEGRIDDFIEIFAKKINGYRSREIAGITVKNILDDLRVKTDFGRIEQKFEIDSAKNLIDDTKLEQFYREVITNNKTAVVGDPGSGKSWFLTNFMEYATAQNVNVIRHYCFTGTDDDLRLERIKSDVFFGNLIADIIDHFPHLQKYKDKLFASDLNELNLLLSRIEDSTIIIIDGLDHIDRVLESSIGLAIDQTQIIEFIKQIESTENVSIILGSQSIVEIDELISDHKYIKHEIAKWSESEIETLMKSFSVENIELSEKKLSLLLYDKSNRNPLYLTYLLKMIQEESSLTIEFINALPEYDFNLKTYYDYLTGLISNNLTSETLACLDFRVNRDELKSIIPRSGHFGDDIKTLAPVLNENYSRGGIKLYHDSFRRYVFEKLSEEDLLSIYKEIIDWLVDKGFYQNQKSYRNLLAYYLKVKNYDAIKKYATNDFLAQSIFYGYAENAIKINYQYFLLTAKNTQDWELFIFLSEFNRAFYSTLSSDYYSEQLEHFDLYYEAVGLVHGFEYANQMLYYDGHKNFDDTLIAKGFYISQNNGFTPNWNLLNDYFKKEPVLDNFKYFLTYLIAINKFDAFCKKKFKLLLSSRNYSFFQIFITETYNNLGYEKILEFFDAIPNKQQNRFGNKINSILDDTNCASRLNVKLETKPTLHPLNLDFVDGYIHAEDLEDFIHLVEQYALYDCDSLRDFEGTIPSKNFFFNWLKFTITNYLIEDEINSGKLHSSSKIEKRIVGNYKFLASDTEPYKGTPRAIDFNHQGRYAIQKSIERPLKYILSSKSWKKIIKCLNSLPFNYLANIENIVNEINIKFMLSSIEEIDDVDSDYYSEHLTYALKKSILYSKLKKTDESKSELYHAAILMTAYTFRKDNTLSEIIEPLLTINKLSPKQAIKYGKKLKYLNEAVERHTEDGKTIRWLIIHWFRELLKIDYLLASKYLISQLLDHEYYWKLQYMLIDFIIHNKQIDPIILHFLHRILPTTNKNQYIESFLDNIHTLITIDSKLAKSSLINVLSRDLNDSHETLSIKTTTKLSALKYDLKVRKKIKQKKKDNFTYSREKTLVQRLDEGFPQISQLSIEEIIILLEKNTAQPQIMIPLFYHLQEKFDDNNIKDFVSKILKIKYRFYDDDYNILYKFIDGLDISNDVKVYLLVELFVYSKSGWYEMFIQKEALTKAASINKELTLSYLSQHLSNLFQDGGSGGASTSNLIIAFDDAGIEKDIILAMYKKAFTYITLRIPHKKEKKWKHIKKISIDSMDNNEIAIVVILAKMKNFDMVIQQEIIYMIDYLLDYNSNLLEKPIHWFFQNLQLFPHSTISGILEVFLLHLNKKKEFFKSFEQDFSHTKLLENLYITNITDEILIGIRDVL
ncbi:ATP-binding protein [Sulfurovum sp. zt1-1]|uniref:ATP-binding protein n=1 Tax=Sulfurovum zhangzhouensis TaxID=3019067 RepID=A0ABT7QWI2_9BACT|nr:ATP-binding protein [Sulfurovum zhangzhouensis]MDM5271202.1 ATP-binding protein [Sulfurovum zhangzhouensis]